MKLLIALGVFFLGAIGIGIMVGAIVYVGGEDDSRLGDVLAYSFGTTGGIIGVILTFLGLIVTRQALEEVFPELKSFRIPLIMD